MLRALVGCILSLAVVALVGMTTASAQAVTIRAMMEPHQSTDALRALLPEFERETGIRVILEDTPYDTLTSKALLNFTRRSSDYDIIMDDWVYGAGFADAGYIVPLDEFIKADATHAETHDFVPGYVNAMVRHGSQYGLPIYGESTFLMYRKDLFEQYGIAVPTTMDELMEAARQVYERSEGDVYGITLRGRQGIHNVYVWAAFLWAFGGQWFDDQGRPALDSPEAIAATQFYAEILRRYGPSGVATYGWEENRLQFQSGRAAMTIDATVNGALAEDPSQSSVVGKVGYAQVPLATRATIGSPNSLQVHGLFISQFSRHKDEAWRFLSWATNKMVQLKSLELYPNAGVPSLSVMDSDTFQSRYGAFSDAMIDAINNGNIDYLPHVTQSNQIIDLVGIAVSSVLAGSRSAEDAMRDANRQIVELMGL
ncbi:sugar ABC transporter substrate-binding protein [Limnochorda pilosa]|uniref:Sugar ABC transporter substrate-binding protein n=1 Tax=Limnochorda pilosa TaxID=1555112 RepID=A0A0K2SM44_LIMPI|nr:sugar ABC transporter substrate-binding protein [Limnochorda pilosa]